MPDNKGEVEEKRLWRPVDSNIWARGPPSGRLKQMAGRIAGFVMPLFVAGSVAVGPLSILISILLVYNFVPRQFFGLGLVAFWSVLVLAFVMIAEKTGYARNFETWNFPLKRIAALPIAFLMVLSLLLLLYAVR